MNKNKNINNTETVLTSRMYLYSKQMTECDPIVKLKNCLDLFIFCFILFLSTKQKLPRDEL